MSNCYPGIGGNEGAVLCEGTMLGTGETPSGPPPSVDNVAIGMRYAEKAGEPIEKNLPSYTIPLEDIPREFVRGMSKFVLGKERSQKAYNTIYKYEERVHKVVDFVRRGQEALHAKI